MFDRLIAAALALVLHYDPSPGETVAEHQERADTIALAVASEAPSAVVGLAVLVVFDGESKFARDIHSGAKTGDHGLAHCMGQLHYSRWIPREMWATLSGIDINATSRCAAATALVLARMRKWCGNWPGAFSAYATGRGCAVIPLGQYRADMLAALLKAH